MMLATFTNSIEADAVEFGSALATAGSDRALIAEPHANTGAPTAGAAYLFNLNIPYPPLNISRNDTNYSLTWITDETGLILQESGLLATPTLWSDTGESVTTTGLTNIVQQGVAIEVTNRFYRLRRP